MQLDRIITLLLSNIEVCKKSGIPILMYHAIDGSPIMAKKSYFETVTSVGRLEEHIQYLKRNHYRVIPLEKIMEYLPTDNKRYAVITFDDGFVDFYEKAYPILQKYQFPATVFLPTKYIGSDEPGLEGRRHMSWGQIRECLDSKIISIGSHTVDHKRMECFQLSELDYQIGKSKYVIEQKTDAKVSLFSFPFRYPEFYKYLISYIEKLLKRYDYKIAVSTRIGITNQKDHVLRYKRIPVNDFDDLPLFEAKLKGCYDWLYTLQKIKKKYMFNI